MVLVGQTVASASLVMKDPKVAVVFGVRNERSIAFAVARKLVETGFRVAVSYTEDTQEDVLYYLEQAGIPTDLCGSVDVRDEAQMVAYLQISLFYFL